MNEAAAEAAATAGEPSATWTPARVAWSLGVFLLAGLLEIGGGWLVWRGVREGRAPRWAYAAGGTLVVAAYAYVPLLQPPSPAAQFGRIYAVYGTAGAPASRARRPADGRGAPLTRPSAARSPPPPPTQAASLSSSRTRGASPSTGCAWTATPHA
jgi:Uncharacterised BCR, YnfA/UPF0060 family